MSLFSVYLESLSVSQDPSLKISYTKTTFSCLSNSALELSTQHNTRFYALRNTSVKTSNAKEAYFCCLFRHRPRPLTKSGTRISFTNLYGLIYRLDLYILYTLTLVIVTFTSTLKIHCLHYTSLSVA